MVFIFFYGMLVGIVVSNLLLVQFIQVETGLDLAGYMVAKSLFTGLLIIGLMSGLVLLLAR